MKKSLSLALLFLSAASTLASAQVAVTWVHAYNAPPSSGDYVIDIAVDASGNVSSTGRSYSPLPVGAHAIETLQYDATGNFLWRARYPSPFGGAAMGYAVAPAPSGALVVTGISSYTPNDTSSNTRQTVVKYDAVGAELWSRHFGSIGPSSGRALLIDPNGDIIVGGQHCNVSFGNPDMCVRKLDPNGATLWTATYDGIAGGVDIVYAIAQAPNGDIVAVGNTGGIIGFTGGPTDFALMRVSSTGTVLWAREVASAGLDETAFSVAVDAAGNAYAVGQLTGAPTLDQAIIAYDSAGNHLWTRTRDGSAGLDDALLKVAIDPFGRVVATGHLFDSVGFLNFGTVVYTAAGNLAWSREWDGASHLDETVGGLVVDAAGNVFVAGTSLVQFPLYTKTEGRIAAYDANGAELYNFAPQNFYNEHFIDIELGPASSLFVGGDRLERGGQSTNYLTQRLDPTAISFCSGDGSGTACPCGNNGLPSKGCANTISATGAWLSVSGSAGASVGTDTLVLTAHEVPGAGMFLQGTGQQASGAGIQFGDGLLCVGGTFTRLGVVFPTGNSAAYPGGLTPSPIHVAGGVVSGDVRHYQCWYRDAITYCTPSTFNLTQGLTIVWGQ